VLNSVFLPFKDKHVGYSAILFGTGPTLKDYDFLEDNGTTLKVGVNGIIAKAIPLDYYFCGHVDARSQLYLPMIKDIPVTYAKFAYVKFNGSRRSTQLDGSKLTVCMSKLEAERLGLLPYEISSNVGFHDDITKHPLVNHLISFSALQFLVYTGIKVIYLVGQDATNIISCDDPEIDPNRSIEAMQQVFTKFRRFAKRKQVRIVSINPVGLTGLFEDCYRRI